MSAMRTTKAPKPVESETMDMSMMGGGDDDGIEVTQPMRGDIDKENKVWGPLWGQERYPEKVQQDQQRLCSDHKV